MSVKEVLCSPSTIMKSSGAVHPPICKPAKTMDILSTYQGESPSCLGSFAQNLKRIWQAIVHFFCPYKKPKAREDLSLSQALQKFHNTRCSSSIHGIYMTTNETGLEKVRAFLSAAPQVKQSCHIGCAGWHNFDITALRRSDYCLIFDFNPENKKFIDSTLTALKSSPTRQDFIETMSSSLRKKNIHFCQKPGKNSESEMRGELNREGSWLATEESYQFIRNLAIQDRIPVISEDVRNTKKFKEISSLLKESGVSIDTVYLSNICIFMRSGSDKEAFASTIRAIASPKTIIINCPRKTKSSFSGEDISNPLMQTVCLGEDIQDQAGISKLFTAHY
jgi:hypothetical protein